MIKKKDSLEEPGEPDSAHVNQVIEATLWTFKNY